jgi:uncharacterized protein DUF6011
MLLSNIFHTSAIEPMPMLASLRDAVLMRSDKRMPKWKFRLADDIVTQIQPKPAKRTRDNPCGSDWFDCHAVINEQADGSALEARRPYGWRIEYRLVIKDEWWFKVDGIGRPTGLDEIEAPIVRQRLINTLPTALQQLRPAMMLKPACLCCGKQLTDPVSMARWVGPECAGTSSAIIPFTICLAGAN